MTDKGFANQNAHIVSASPYRAVLRRKYDAPNMPEEDSDRDRKSDDDEEEENDEVGQFERALNDVSEISDNNAFTTGRPI